MSEDEKGRSLSALNIECIATAAAFVIFNAYTYITSVYTME